MSEAPAEFVMPSTATIIAQVVDDMDLHSRHKLSGLGPAVMRGVATMILTPGLDQKDALAALWEEHGEESVSRSGFYNWAADFRERFGKARNRYRRKAVEAEASRPVAGNLTLSVTRIKSRLLSMAARELADADDLGDLKDSELSSTLAMVESISRNEAREREADLKSRDLERKLAESERQAQNDAQKAEKLDAEIALLRQRHAQLPERLKTLQTEFDSLSKRVASGGSVKSAVLANFAQALREVREQAESANAGEVAA